MDAGNDDQLEVLVRLASLGPRRVTYVVLLSDFFDEGNDLERRRRVET